MNFLGNIHFLTLVEMGKFRCILFKNFSHRYLRKNYQMRRKKNYLIVPAEPQQQKNGGKLANMSALYEPGDILRIAHIGRVDGQTKHRPCLFWMQHKNDANLILISGIFSNASGREWELFLNPAVHNGLTKNCVLRFDNTIFIDKSAVLAVLGRLNPLELLVVKEKMFQYSETVKADSSKDYDSDVFSIFE